MRRSPRDPLADLIFTETNRLRLARGKIARLKLETPLRTVVTEHGDITIKLGLSRAASSSSPPNSSLPRRSERHRPAPPAPSSAAATSAARERFQQVILSGAQRESKDL